MQSMNTKALEMQKPFKENHLRFEIKHIVYTNVLMNIKEVGDEQNYENIRGQRKPTNVLKAEIR